MLEVDANPNPLREDVLGELLTVRDGMLALPEGPGLGFMPDMAAFAALRTLYLDARG